MSAAGPILVKKRDRKLLVVSPRAELRKEILDNFGPESLPATEVVGGAGALLKLGETDFHTLVLDPNIQDLEVEELVATIRARYPALNVVVLDHEHKERHISYGSYDRPADIETQENPPDGSIAALWSGPSALTERLTAAPAAKIDSLPGMIGTSPKMQQAYRLARLVAPRDTSVLIVGATGTGKELIARGIHQLSRRNQRPFIVVNCAAIPESLLEAELFGFTRGAFTGAVQARLGRIHAAHCGTLLLDEVGELSLGMQAKLLRFLQEGEVQRLGSADILRVDARVIASTNADLLQRAREKQFREDLYYRLAVFPVHLPPLRDRADDILPLALHFLETFCRHADVPQKLFSLEAVILLQKYLWPGNVRELQHWIERAFILSEANGQIRAEDLRMSSTVSEITEIQ
jgi:DNA-binding NtrC family response regulator